MDLKTSRRDNDLPKQTQQNEKSPESFLFEGVDQLAYHKINSF